MAAQTREQGRYLGGRPPYGYRLADAGPHPNKAYAAWGRRAHRLEPDPVTAPTVRWIFAQRLARHSLARITRALNDAGIPCPSAADPRRNPHRSGAAWKLNTVAAILGNPRYTGRQVWNRQRTVCDLVDPANTGLGHRPVQRWNLPEGWVISAPAPPTRRWSARPTSSPSRTRARPAAPPVPRRAGTCWPGCCAAGPTGGAWSPPGPTTGPLTGAATAIPVPAVPILNGQRMSTSARTRSCLTWPPWPSCYQARTTRGRALRKPSPRADRGADRLPAGRRRHPHLRPGQANSPDRHRRPCSRHHRPESLTPRRPRPKKGDKSAGKSPALAEAGLG